jgi:hypothetical protein
VFPSVYTYFPVFGVPTVVGVHDAIADSFPELTLPDRRLGAPSRGSPQIRASAAPWGNRAGTPTSVTGRRRRT